MTDQLDSDLRALLSRRVAAVDPDARVGEEAIARRLAAGDTAVAEEISLDPPRRRTWLVAAAVLVVAAVGAAVMVTEDDDPTVRTGPVATLGVDQLGDHALFVGDGSRDEVVLAYLSDRLGVREEVIAVVDGPSAGLVGGTFVWSRMDVTGRSGGVVGVRRRWVSGSPAQDGRWEIVDAYSDGASIDAAAQADGRVEASATGLAGAELRMSVHQLDGTSIESVTCLVEDAQSTSTCLVQATTTAAVTVRLSILVGSTPVTFEERRVPVAEGEQASTALTSTTVVAGDDPTVGAPGDSAKDVAERFMLDVFGDSAVAVAVDDQRAGTAFVEMSSSSGTTISAEVVDEDGVWRVRSVRSSGFTMDPRETLSVGVYEAGTVVVQGYADTSGSRAICGASCPRGPSVASAEVIAEDVVVSSDLVNGVAAREYSIGEAAWISVTLTTPDGRTFYELSPR